MKRIVIAAILSSITLVACSDKDDALRVLSDQGYKEINAKGWAMFGCGEGDTWNTEFEATSPAGSRVTGNVCKGWFKGSTIRLN